MNSVARRELLVYGFCRELARKAKFVGYIPDSVLYLVIMNHPQLMIESDIITTALLEDQLYDILCAKMGESEDRFTLNRIFNSRHDGKTGRSFHTFCDETEYPTIILIKSCGYNEIFGGYTNTSWRPSTSIGWTNKIDAFSFLFRFSREYKGYYMKRQDRMKNIQDNIFELIGLSNDCNPDVIRCNLEKGPVFGHGCDLFISHDGKGCYSSPESYDIPDSSTLAGAEEFDVDIYEVFELKQPHWICNVCTFENKGVDGLCQMCYQPKGSQT